MDGARTKARSTRTTPTVVLLGDFNSRLQRHAGNGRLVGNWCMHTRLDRGGKQLALSRCPDAMQRPAMELAGPRTQNGRAPPCATSPTTMRQTNPRISLWRCIRTGSPSSDSGVDGSLHMPVNRRSRKTEDLLGSAHPHAVANGIHGGVEATTQLALSRFRPYCEGRNGTA